MDKVIELISETCGKIIASNSGFKQTILEQLSAFIKSPLNRTADVVADLHVFTTQVFTYNKLREEQKKIICDPQAAEEAADMKVDRNGFCTYARFCIEEVLRRSQKRNEDLSKTELLQILVPDYESIVETLKSAKQREI